MMRLMLSISIASAAGTNYSWFCQVKCGEQLINSCSNKNKCNVSSGCTWFAENAFTKNDGVCEGFMKSGPACESVNHTCYEAVDFQLIWDRNLDFMNSVKAKDWPGIGAMMHPSGVMFVPGDASFSYQADAEKVIAEIGQNVALIPQVEQVLTTGKELERTIHAIGSWRLDGSNMSKPFYSRWIANAKGHWVIETLVVELGSSAMEAAVEEDGLLKEISQRSADLSKAYNSGNLTQLMDFYDEKAVIVTKGDRPFEKHDLAAKKSFLGKDAKLESKLVTQGPGSNAVHEVGYSYSTRSGYLARWVKAKDSWVVESQIFTVFPSSETIFV